MLNLLQTLYLELAFYWQVLPLANHFSLDCWNESLFFLKNIGNVSIFQIWWQCCKEWHYWKLIYSGTEWILKIAIHFQAEIFLLNFTKPVYYIPKHSRSSIIYVNSCKDFLCLLLEMSVSFFFGRMGNESVEVCLII